MANTELTPQYDDSKVKVMTPDYELYEINERYWNVGISKFKPNG